MATRYDYKILKIFYSYNVQKIQDNKNGNNNKVKKSKRV